MSGNAAAGAQGNTDSAAKTGEQQGTQVEQKTGEQKTGEQGKASTETPPADGKAGDKAGEQGKQSEGEKGSKAGDTPKAPETYQLTIPDDAKEFIDADVLKSVEAMARESGWSAEDAQNAVNEHGLMLKKANDAFLAQLKADADYGGDKLAETQRLAKSAIDLIRPEGHPRREAFMRAINRVAAGNHPEFVSFLADLGKRAAEDSTGQATGASKAGGKSAEDVLYGGSAKK